MTLVIDPELKAYIDPLTPDEYEALERSLLSEGCRDALVLWGDVLVDGHNRYAICQKHGLPFQTVQHPRFQSLEDVHLWMIDQHLGRRSVSNYQRGVLALRKSEIMAGRRAQPAAAPWEGEAAEGHDQPAPADSAESSDTTARAEAALPRASREAIAKAARLSSSQVVMIEKIQKQAAPEVVAAVRSGALSINAAAVVASLPAEEQAAAAAAGPGELKQVAKRVRDAKRMSSDRKPREEKPSDDSPRDAAGGDASLDVLHKRIAELTAENVELRLQVMALQAQLSASA